MFSEAELRIVNSVASYLSVMSKHLPDDVFDRLSEMRKNEKNDGAKAVYDCMFKNLDMAVTLDRPICQDTGLIQFFIKAGSGFPYLANLKNILTEAVRIATEVTPLRPNAVDTFREKNSGNNIAVGSPWIEWDIVSGSDDAEIEIYMAGGGCSLPGKALVLMPSAGYEGVAKAVLETVCDRGINACPPLIVGVGIGTCADSAGLLSKKALLRGVGTENPDKDAQKLEKMLFEGLNNIGIGPNGITGTESVLDVHVEFAAHHPATLAVGISVGCWATRYGRIHFNSDLSYEIKTHGGVTL
ncbi:MAG: L(+)-tartrate dehydratase subunit alpha [Clostridia bacterium]|nr:L(+)-tartrate dehydratase subunit alpha [Clostridia bacterium]